MTARQLSNFHADVRLCRQVAKVSSLSLTAIFTQAALRKLKFLNSPAVDVGIFQMTVEIAPLRPAFPLNVKLQIAGVPLFIGFFIHF